VESRTLRTAWDNVAGSSNKCCIRRRNNGPARPPSPLFDARSPARGSFLLGSFILSASSFFNLSPQCCVCLASRPVSSRRAFQPKPSSCRTAANGCTRSSTTASGSSPARRAYKWDSTAVPAMISWSFSPDRREVGPPALALLIIDGEAHVEADRQIGLPRRYYQLFQALLGEGSATQILSHFQSLPRTIIQKIALYK